MNRETGNKKKKYFSWLFVVYANYCKVKGSSSNMRKYIITQMRIIAARKSCRRNGESDDTTFSPLHALTGPSILSLSLFVRRARQAPKLGWVSPPRKGRDGGREEREKKKKKCPPPLFPSFPLPVSRPPVPTQPPAISQSAARRKKRTGEEERKSSFCV